MPPKKVKLDVDLNSLTKKPRFESTEEEKLSIKQPIKKVASVKAIITPKGKVFANPFGAARSTSGRSTDSKKEQRPFSA